MSAEQADFLQYTAIIKPSCLVWRYNSIMEAGSLQSILATLAQFGHSQVPDLSQTSQHTSGLPLIQGNDSTTPPGEPAVASPNVKLQQAQDPRLTSQTPSGTASPRRMIDPASITQWQEGLRCVTKIAAQNVQFAACLKKVSSPLLLSSSLSQLTPRSHR